MDFFSSGWWQEGHLTTKSLHQLPLTECTFPPFLFLHRRPFFCLGQTWWDGVKEIIWKGRLKTETTSKVQQLTFHIEWHITRLVDAPMSARHGSEIPRQLLNVRLWRSRLATFTVCQSSAARHNTTLAHHTLSRRAFAVMGPTVWNSLPDDLRAQQNSDCFCRHLKTFLFSHYQRIQRIRDVLWQCAI